MTLLTFHLLLIALVAAVLTVLARKLARDGFGRVLVLEYAWLAFLAAGNLAGLGRNQPFNNLLPAGVLLIPFLWLAPTIWFPRSASTHQRATSRSLRPAWVLIVVVCGIFFWINVRNV